ncbi:GGDEF domain-containing protein [Pontiella sulfatireligans]|uniref:diguanylate cyclase n=1 Tax=Pontiella sulfatireligans TaxID=2750658 RepID=A0A6C2UIK5_9BACT|nr:GGDEF domain-containing protein [Pontiella sulfatireligans]VGO20045.1 Response regulator PleD [Pontiella sulfatireligans]
MSDAETNLPLWLAFLSLNEQATRDWLTGLRNRRYFEETLADHVAAANRYDRELSLALFDIDQFKQINDQNGHEAGDSALKHFAELLTSTARAADIVCRYGGDEFAVILPETNKASAEHFAERVAAKQMFPTITAGIAALPCENLVAEADAHLIFRKKESRR